MKDTNLNMLELSPDVFITAGLGIIVGVDFQDRGEILFTRTGGYFQSAEQ